MLLAGGPHLVRPSVEAFAHQQSRTDAAEGDHHGVPADHCVARSAAGHALLQAVEHVSKSLLCANERTAGGLQDAGTF